MLGAGESELARFAVAAAERERMRLALETRMGADRFYRTDHLPFALSGIPSSRRSSSSLASCSRCAWQFDSAGCSAPHLHSPHGCPIPSLRRQEINSGFADFGAPADQPEPDSGQFPLAELRGNS
jgi:hypothetical protein